MPIGHNGFVAPKVFNPYSPFITFEASSMNGHQKLVVHWVGHHVFVPPKVIRVTLDVITFGIGRVFMPMFEHLNSQWA
jgi:hypothetical protein